VGDLLPFLKPRQLYTKTGKSESHGFKRVNVDLLQFALIRG
jgi:hypothetical protein